MHEIETLIHHIAKLPGFGPKSAKRAVLHLLKNKDSLLKPLGDALLSTYSAVKKCAECGNLDVSSPCSVCLDSSRDETIICVVAGVSDLWALNNPSIFKGRFHVLGGLLSPMDGITPNDLNISKLINRVNSDSTKEVVLATNLTIEGQTTAHYIADILLNCNVKVTRLSHGVPMGGEIDYMDEGTLLTALTARCKVD